MYIIKRALLPSEGREFPEFQCWFMIHMSVDQNWIRLVK